MCREIEEKYKQNFIDCLFNKKNKRFKCPNV